MSQTKYGVITTTVSSREDAVKIAHALLGQKLAACVQLMPIESFYSWKGENRQDAEILLLIKTRAALFEDAMRAIARLHPYETPEILVSAIAHGHPPYLAWIDAATAAD